MRYHVLVDSRDRDFAKHPAPNSYRVRLPRTYKNVVGARLLSADIPLSFYVFSAAMGNTTLHVSVGGGAVIPVVIDDGNYNPATLGPELQRALAASFPGKTFAVAIDARTMRLVVECEDGDEVAVDTTAHAAGAAPWTDWGLAYYLGFAKGVVAAGAPLVGPGVVNLAPFTYVLLDIAELGTVDEGALYGDAVGRGSFCKIPVNGASYEVVFRDIHSAPELVDSRPPVPRLETLHISFRTHDNKPIDFRGVEHSFLLELVTRDPSPWHSSARPAFVVPAAAQPAAHGKARRRRSKAPPPPPTPPARRTVGAKTVVLGAAAAVGAWYAFRWYSGRPTAPGG